MTLVLFLPLLQEILSWACYNNENPSNMNPNPLSQFYPSNKRHETPTSGSQTFDMESNKTTPKA